MASGTLRRLEPTSPADSALPAERPVSGPASVPSPCAPGLDQVYEAHFRYVWRCLKSLGVEPAHLDDAAHDVFLVVQRKLPSFDGEQARLTTWLYEIALRVGRRYRTRRAREGARHVELATDDERAPLATPAEGAPELERSERLELARAALATLDDAKREAFVLACIEQRSAPEIARITGLPLNTVYSRIRAARQAFQAEIDRRRAADRRAP
jgi:RNA polymerase sigma-70 factor, ECF subfamily